MKIDIVHPGYLRVAAGDLERAGLGGNETAMVLAARLLAGRGHQVRAFADCDPAEDQGRGGCRCGRWRSGSTAT